MIVVEKKNVTLSLPVETNKKLEELAHDYGMTKSGIVNYWVNKTKEDGSLFK